MSAVISARIISKVGEGLSVADAIDAVLGAGTYKQLANEIYDALAAK